MKKIITSLLLILGFCLQGKAQLLPMNQCESSPCGALPICGNTITNIYSYQSNTGNPTGVGTCASSTGTFTYNQNWVYYRFKCYTTGTFNFTLTPNDATSDLDWAMWNVTTSGCSSITNSNMIECNAADVLGATGIQTGGLPAASFENNITITAGSSYIIGISRNSNGTVTTGFTMNFTGTTASILDNVKPYLASYVPLNFCAPVDSMILVLSERVRNSQVAAGDFTITNNPAFTITKNGTSGCTNAAPNPSNNYSNSTDTVTMHFTSSLAPGNYTINITSATSFFDLCGNADSTAPVLTFTVANLIHDSIRTGFNCATAKYIDTVYAVYGASPYSYKATGSGQSGTFSSPTAANYMVFTNISGGSPYKFTVKDANNCSDSVTITHATYIPMSIQTYKKNPACYSTAPPYIDTYKVVTVTGGASPNTYALTSTPASNATAATQYSPGCWTNLAQGTYTITVTNAYGCTATASASVAVPPQLTLPTPSGTNPLCNGAANGTLTATPSGGSSPYTYTTSPFPLGTWSPLSGPSSTCTGLLAGTYTVVTTDASGCTASATKTLVAPTAITVTVPAGSKVNPTCTNPCSGSALVSMTGGSGSAASKKIFIYPVPVGYTDTIFAASGTFSNLCQGTYTVVGKDIGGCTNSTTFTLTLPPIPDIVSDSIINVTCNAGCSGKIYNTTTGGVAPYVYTITPSPNAPCGAPVNVGAGGDYTNLPAGTYKVVVTGNNSCKDSVENLIITEPAALVITNIDMDSVNCSGQSNGTLTITATGGTGIYTYKISTAATYQASNVFAGLAASTYTITVKDANGCTTTSAITVLQPSPITFVVNSIDSVTCYGQSNGGLSVTATGGNTGTYTILNYSISPAFGLQNPAGVFTGLPTFNYTVTCTDQYGCTGTTTVFVPEPTLLTISVTSTVQPYCYDSNGVINVLGAGGVEGSGYVYTVTNPAGASVLIDNGGGSFSNASCGYTYTITVTDYHSCTAFTTENIACPPPPTISSIVADSVNCNGGNDGSLLVHATSQFIPLNYSINGGATQTDSLFSNLVAGQYTIVVTDAHNCTSSSIANVYEPNLLITSVTSSANISCNAVCDGDVVVGSIGGSAIYSYTILPIGPLQPTSGHFTGLCANVTYTITSTDFHSCQATTTVILTEPTVLTASAMVDDDVSCFGLCDGEAIITPGGGTTFAGGAYHYAISGSAGAPSINFSGTLGTASNLCAGTFTVTVTDSHGCTASTVFTITQPAVLAANIVLQSNASCNGVCDGTATASGTGGTLDYTFAITAPGVINPLTGAMTGLCAGSYTVTVTDDHGCSATSSITITEPLVLVASIVPVSLPTCLPGCDGTAQASAVGGTTAYTYSILPASATVNPSTGAITGICAGITYTVTVTDANLCSDTETINLTTPNAPTVSVLSIVDASCNGLCDGTAQAGGSGNAPFTYSITAPGVINATTGAITNLCAGTYTVTIVDVNGCVGTTTFNVGEPALLVTDVSSSANISCNGVCDGDVVVGSTGGTPTYNYTILPAGPLQPTSGHFTGLCANVTYTITGTDSHNCQATTTITLTEPNLLTADALVIPDDNVSCFGLCDGTATITPTDGTPFVGGDYHYAISGSTGAPAINFSGVVGNASNLCAGTFTVTVTDSHGCTASTVFTITQPAVLAANIVLQSNASCNGVCDGTATASGTGGTLDYSFSITAPGVIDLLTGDMTNLCAGSYTVTVTDANGCSATSSITITEPLVLVASLVPVSLPTCLPGCDGTAQASALGGTTAYTYSILPASATVNPSTGAITGICAGITYTVTVTDANGCSDTETINLTTPGGPTANVINIVDASCNGSCNGSAQAGGLGNMPFTYYVTAPGVIDSVTGYISGLCAGTYTVTVKDVNGCIGTTTFNVTEPAVLVANAVTVSNVSCFGACDGTAQASAVGGTTNYSYSILPSGSIVANSGLASNLCAGIIYTITVTDALNCQSTTTVTVTEPLALTATASVIPDDNVSCFGLCDGSATITPNGGTPFAGGDYHYAINGLSGAPTINFSGSIGNASNLCVGTYTVTVTDINGCTTTTTFDITEPAQLTANIVPLTEPSCNGDCDGTATAVGTGGTLDYTFGISSGGIDNLTGDMTNLCATGYTVTITDANGCTATSSINVSQPAVLIANVIAGVLPTCTPGCDGTAQASAIGGTPTYSYGILPASATINASTGAITGICAGVNYTITVTDANGCIASQAITLITPGGPTLVLNTSTNPSCNPDCDGTATFITSNGQPNYTYGISPSSGTVNLVGNASNLCSGIAYTITVTDANSCVGTASVTLSLPPSPIVTVLSSTQATCNPGCDGTVTLNPSNLTYTISPVVGPIVGNVINGLCAGTVYTVTGTDANGCSGTTTVTVTTPLSPAAPTVTSTTPASCSPGCDGTATLSPINLTYTVTPSIGITVVNNVISGLCDGPIYTVTGTDANGCTGTTTVTVGTTASPAAPSVVTTTPASCLPGCDGTATMSPNTLTYSVAPAAGTTVVGTLISGLCVGTTYTVTGTDANGCTGTTTATVVNANAPVISVLSTTQATCNPNCNGTATMSPANLTYSVLPSIGTSVAANIISGLCAGTTYTVTGTNANGCAGTTTVTVTTTPSPAPPTVASTTPASCGVGCNGTVTMNPNTLTYTVAPSAGTTVVGTLISGLCVGTTYTVTGTNANGCTSTTTATVVNANAPVVDTISTTLANCVPGCNGTATMTPANLTYTISPSAGTSIAANVISGLCAGTSYTITGTNTSLCSGSKVISINSTPSTPINLVSSTPASCSPGCDGTATFNPAAGIVYTISPSAGSVVGNVINALCAGTTYTVTGTNANGCTATTTVTIGTTPSPTVSVTSITLPFTALSNNGVIQVAGAGGTPGYTYTISPTFPSIAQGPVGTFTGIHGDVPCINYTITVTDTKGCTSTVDTCIGLSAQLFITDTFANVSCFGACNGVIDANATGGTGNYTFSIAANFPNTANIDPVSGLATGLCPDTYTITVSDGLVSVTKTQVITQPLAALALNAPVVIDPSCNGNCNGSISVTATGGTAPINYTITGGSFTNLCSGSYTITAIDAKGCSLTTSVTLINPALLVLNSLNSTNVVCNGLCNGTATAVATGGTGTLTYSIAPSPSSNTTGLFTGLCPNTYIVTVTDTKGCSVTSTLTITEPTALAWSVTTHTNISCFGANNGTIQVSFQNGSGTPNYSYSKNGGPYTPNGNFIGLAGGTYTITGKDANGCTLSTIFNIIEPSIITLTVPIVINVNCNGDNTGSIILSASGGTGTIYTYTIPLQPANTNGTFTGLPAGNYTVTVYDSSGCYQQTSNVQITEPPAIVFSQVNVQAVPCYGTATGSITVSANGGTPNITFGISPNVGSQTVNGFFSALTSGFYTITATDGKGCTKTTTTFVPQNPALYVDSILIGEPICNGDGNGSVFLIGAGGVSPIQFALNGGPFQGISSSTTFTNLFAGPYTLTLRDILGCTMDTIITVTEPLPVGAIQNIRDVNCVDSKDGSIYVTGTGGRGGYKYYITPGLHINKSGVFTGLASGTYTLRVVDTAGCEYTNVFTINPPANPLNNVITKQDLGCNGKGNEGSATANVSGGQQPYVYLWNTDPVQTTATANSLYYGYYSVQIVDANGCTLMDTIYINEGPCCDVSFIPNAFSPNGDQNNDEFRVLTTAGVILKQLEIYSRWGKRVWSTSDYTQGWNGMIDGKEAPIDTYYYVLRYKCTLEPEKDYIEKGDVILVR